MLSGHRRQKFTQAVAEGRGVGRGDGYPVGAVLARAVGQAAARARVEPGQDWARRLPPIGFLALAAQLACAELWLCCQHFADFSVH